MGNFRPFGAEQREGKTRRKIAFLLNKYGVFRVFVRSGPSRT